MEEGISVPTTVNVESVTAPTEEVRCLIGELDQELSQNYPPEQRHGLSLDAIFQPHIRFFVARIDEAGVGCGGVALFPDFAEIKRMYVRQACRGQGIADAIVARLEAEVLASGLTLVRLETGVRQPAAIRFYERTGFYPCEAFEPYSSMPPEKIVSSFFMEKKLSG